MQLSKEHAEMKMKTDKIKNKIEQNIQIAIENQENVDGLADKAEEIQIRFKKVQKKYKYRHE